ncbi:hypothetical protein [Natrinema sp. SYSU A 869]|uniref:hypothetical protein n=1 Tax=Natrinema sp. SYSU A 869 TaxID=2871694 RepID=UPI002106E551|nr:hypothetical protein [Natrinema sp. SYSU A 869]
MGNSPYGWAQPERDGFGNVLSDTAVGTNHSLPSLKVARCSGDIMVGTYLETHPSGSDRGGYRLVPAVAGITGLHRVPVADAMCATFTDDDLGKPVENDNGESVGVVAAVEGNVAHVRPDPSAVESIKSSLGWEKGAEEMITLDHDSVREITDDAVQLESELPVRTESDTEPSVGHDESPDQRPETDPTGSTSGTDETEIATDMADDDGLDAAEEMDQIEERGRGATVDPTELADRDSGLSVQRDEDLERTDAAVDIDEDAQRTDAAVDPEGETSQTDAEVDPDALRETEATDRGPTTEDGAQSVEDAPETERLTDAGSDTDSNGREDE